MEIVFSSNEMAKKMASRVSASGVSRGGQSAVDQDDSVDQHLQPLPSVLGPLVNDPLLSDVAFIVEAQTVFAHRVILAAWSPVFKVRQTLVLAHTLRVP
jgi:hypothetical protein